VERSIYPNERAVNMLYPNRIRRPAFSLFELRIKLQVLFKRQGIWELDAVSKVLFDFGKKCFQVADQTSHSLLSDDVRGP
jgi:hypothetical protein